VLVGRAQQIDVVLASERRVRDDVNAHEMLTVETDRSLTGYEASHAFRPELPCSFRQ
jgi:hypothetical protein